MRFFAVVILALLGRTAAPGAEPDSCVACHSALDGNLQEPAKKFSDDIHKRAGFTCTDCHGGDRTSDDMEVAKSPAKGFRGKVSRAQTPVMCARCHSDAALMHKFKPQQRVDQLAQYQTSVHGKRLAAGDTAVANCVDCHSVHDIREVRNPLAPVHPFRLPGTCARCHADAKHMAKYKIPTSQFADYQTSVHWLALSKRRDLSAPSCASCHGNHGATPPQVSSVTAVCGTCHALMQDLYQKSPHEPVFAAMGVAGCVGCHGNHAIAAPTPEMLVGGKAVCAPCHEAGSTGGKVAVRMFAGIQELSGALTRSGKILERARQSGMEVSDALVELQEAQQTLVKARVAVHAFRTEAVEQPVAEGLAAARKSYAAGEAAMRERDKRHRGLAISLAGIFVTVAALWLAIRRIENGKRNSNSIGN